ncbi:hypothetical protein RhiirA1_476895 [Rhizophagus irregularis]|uniref:RNase H type-1 domain-containing protein n=1 Tax=Rhizophagus irregularis TaxID=588596 RepID=A0A2N0QUH0_9GLOM|nr:hypothetical protein RhiirA1_476895 [Rhizophagus irregularis]
MPYKKYVYGKDTFCIHFMYVSIDSIYNFEVLSNPTDMSIVMRKCEEKSNNNISIEKILSINLKIKCLEKVYIYIDGSVINSGTENIEGLAGINIYDNEHNFINEIYFSIENWISPIKAETAAFLIALIIAFNVENVKFLPIAKMFIENIIISLKKI